MEHSKHCVYVSYLSLFTFLILISCDGPNDVDIREAVTISLKKKVPISLARHLTGGQKATIDELKIIQIGKAQGEGSSKYWFVKIYVKGTCNVMFGGRKRFEGETEYRIRKDSYDNWVASPSRL